MIISLICLFFSAGASNSKRYYAKGWDIVTVSEDTVAFYGSVFYFGPDESTESMEKAVCHLTHEKENSYKIQNFEYPEDKALKNISVTGWDSDTIEPGWIVIVFKDLKLDDYMNMQMQMHYEIDGDIFLYSFNKKIDNKDCVFSFELKKDYPDRSIPRYVYFSATPINYSWYSESDRYFGTVEVSRLIKPISVPSCNYVEIRIPNLSDRIFQEYLIKGDYVYIDSKKIIWNGIEYERIKPNDRRLKRINAKMGWNLGK